MNVIISFLRDVLADGNSVRKCDALGNVSDLLSDGRRDSRASDDSFLLSGWVMLSMRSTHISITLPNNWSIWGDNARWRGTDQRKRRRRQTRQKERNAAPCGFGCTGLESHSVCATAGRLRFQHLMLLLAPRRHIKVEKLKATNSNCWDVIKWRLNQSPSKFCHS